jgi:DNA-binding LytR/AlgR family response regulator
LKKVLLRSTLSLIHQQLGSFEFFIKCHRSYVVNRNHIVSTSGNAQGLKLKLKDIEEPIPVSRTLTKLFL